MALGKVLIVDDDLVNLRVASNHLGLNGISSRIVSNGSFFNY